MDRRELESIAVAYGFDDVAARLTASGSDDIALGIGVLGEFSSGKSSLVNALIGRELLPVADRPTTGAITVVEVRADAVEPQFFIERDDVREPASALKFQDATLGEIEGRPILVIPSSGVLQDGYRIVDTPGLDSLDELHTAITYGELPFLDGALVCSDVNRGGLPNSILEFLGRPEIVPLRRRFLFVLTRADQKDSAGAEKVRSKVLETLRALYSPDELSAVPEEQRVIVTSARNHLAAGPDPGLQRLERAFGDVFVASRRELVEERRGKLVRALAVELLDLLADRRANLEVTDHELREKENTQQQALEQARASRSAASRRLDDFEGRLREGLIGLSTAFVPRFESASAETVGAVAQSYSKEVCDLVELMTSELSLSGGTLPTLAHVGEGLRTRIEAVLRKRELAVAASTAIILALATGGAGAAANTIEAAGYAAGRRAAMQAGRAAAEGAAKTLLRKSAVFVATVLRDANPLEYIGTLVADQFKARAARDELASLANSISTRVRTHVQATFEVEVFQPIEADIQARHASLQAARQERARSESERAGLKSRLTEHHRALQREVSRA